MKKPWIGVDLDGTLARYEAYQEGVVGDPIWPMVERVRAVLAAGQYDVRVFTARANNFNDVTAIRDFLIMAGLAGLEITDHKDPACIEIWGDRCRQVLRNAGEFALPYDGDFTPNMQKSYHDIQKT